MGMRKPVCPAPCQEPAGLPWVVAEATDPETGATQFRTTPIALPSN